MSKKPTKPSFGGFFEAKIKQEKKEDGGETASRQEEDEGSTPAPPTEKSPTSEKSS